MKRLLPALGGGVLLGILVTLAYTRMDSSPAPGPEDVVRDITDIPTVTQAVAQKHREEQYANLQTIEQVVALPTAFARAEAIHVLAGRSDSGGVQNLIFDANRVADDIQRAAILNVLFQRLAELDPQSALALSRMEQFRGTRTLEERVWRSWARNDLDDALSAARAQPSMVQQSFAAQSLYAAFGYMGNETTDYIESELGIQPDRSTRGRYLYQLADESPAEAIDFINGLERGARQREYVSWLGYHLAQRDASTAMRYADLFEIAADRRTYESAVNNRIAQQDPRAALERVLADGSGNQTRAQIYSAARELAATDLEAALLFFEQARRGQQRDTIGSVIAAEMARKNPVEAVAWARANDSARYSAMEMAALQTIAETDPQLAINEALASPKAEYRSLQVSSVIMQIASNDPQQAIAYLDEIPDKGHRLDASQRLATMWMQNDPDAAANWILSQDGEIKEQLIARAGQQLVATDVDAAMRMLPRLDAEQQEMMRGQIARQLALSRSADDASAFIRQFQGQPGFDRLQASIVTGVAESDPRTAKQLADQIPDVDARDSAYREIIGQHARANPVEAVRWLGGISDDQMRSAAAGRVAAEWHSRDPVAALRWIRSLPVGSMRDDAIMNSMSRSSEITAEQQELIATIQDKEKRGQAKLRMIYRIMQTDRARARELLKDDDIPSLQRQQIEDMWSRY